MCCMAEPKLYDILRWQIGEVQRTSSPTAISSSTTKSACKAGTKAAARCRLTPGEILAENVKQCTPSIRSEDPNKPIYVWSDMFDPYHNAAKTGRYYLVKGDGPWFGSWKGLDKDVHNRQLELRPRQTRRVAKAFRRPAAIARFSPATTTGQSQPSPPGFTTPAPSPA